MLAWEIPTPEPGVGSRSEPSMSGTSGKQISRTLKELLPRLEYQLHRSPVLNKINTESTEPKSHISSRDSVDDLRPDILDETIQVLGTGVRGVIPLKGFTFELDFNKMLSGRNFFTGRIGTKRDAPPYDQSQIPGLDISGDGPLEKIFGGQGMQPLKIIKALDKTTPIFFHAASTSNELNSNVPPQMFEILIVSLLDDSNFGRTVIYHVPSAIVSHQQIIFRQARTNFEFGAKLEEHIHFDFPYVEYTFGNQSYSQAVNNELIPALNCWFFIKWQVVLGNPLDYAAPPPGWDECENWFP